jgi:hypothetical protein
MKENKESLNWKKFKNQENDKKKNDDQIGYNN